MAEECEATLDSILDNEPAAETPAVEAVPAEPEAEQPRGPDGKFLPKQTTGVEPEETPEAVPPTDKLPPEEYKAIREEREKRQAAESRLTALEQQLQQLQQPKEPPAPPPSIWEDEGAWSNHFGNKVVQQASFNATLNLSEMLTRKENADFDEMKTRFLSMAEQNPAIVQQALSDPDPWGKAYKIAKNAATMEDLGATDLETLKAKLREEIAAELQASTPVPQPGLPPTLTTERSVGNRSGPAWAGPSSIDDILRQ